MIGDYGMIGQVRIWWINLLFNCAKYVIRELTESNPFIHAIAF